MKREHGPEKRGTRVGRLVGALGATGLVAATVVGLGIGGAGVAAASCASTSITLVTVHKSDSETGKPLAGASFDVAVSAEGGGSGATAEVLPLTGDGLTAWRHAIAKAQQDGATVTALSKQILNLTYPAGDAYTKALQDAQTAHDAAVRDAQAALDTATEAQTAAGSQTPPAVAPITTTPITSDPDFTVPAGDFHTTLTVTPAPVDGVTVSTDPTDGSPAQSVDIPAGGSATAIPLTLTAGTVDLVREHGQPIHLTVERGMLVMPHLNTAMGWQGLTSSTSGDQVSATAVAYPWTNDVVIDAPVGGATGTVTVTTEPEDGTDPQTVQIPADGGRVHLGLWDGTVTATRTDDSGTAVAQPVAMRITDGRLGMPADPQHLLGWTASAAFGGGLTAVMLTPTESPVEAAQADLDAAQAQDPAQDPAVLKSKKAADAEKTAAQKLFSEVETAGRSMGAALAKARAAAPIKSTSTATVTTGSDGDAHVVVQVPCGFFPDAIQLTLTETAAPAGHVKVGEPVVVTIPRPQVTTADKIVLVSGPDGSAVSGVTEQMVTPAAGEAETSTYATATVTVPNAPVEKPAPPAPEQPAPPVVHEPAPPAPEQPAPPVVITAGSGTPASPAGQVAGIALIAAGLAGSGAVAYRRRRAAASR